jgi:uncharacterized membrane protein
MTLWSSILQRLWFPLFTPEERRTIVDVIGTIEKKTQGEIRISIRRRRNWKERKLSYHQTAMNEFYRLGMDKTKAKTGVLVFRVLSDRQFEIVADEGIHTRVKKEFWTELAGELSLKFNQNKFLDGILSLLNRIGTVLEKEFPIQDGDTNELSNDIVIS